MWQLVAPWLSDEMVDFILPPICYLCIDLSDNLQSTRWSAIYHYDERHNCILTSSYFARIGYAGILLKQEDSWYTITIKKSWMSHSTDVLEHYRETERPKTGGRCFTDDLGLCCLQITGCFIIPVQTFKLIRKIYKVQFHFLLLFQHRHCWEICSSF